MDQKLSLSARMLGALRALLVCCFLRRWGWSNAANIALCVGVNRLRYADELVDRGFSIRLETGLRYADRYAYILSDYGLQCAIDELDQFGDMLPVLPPYTYTTHQRLPFSHHVHNMVAQEILLRVGDSDDLKSFTLWTTEWEERHSQDNASCVDLIDRYVETPHLPNGHSRLTRLHEVELNQKTGAKLNHWLGLRIGRLLELGEGSACCCVWAASNAIIDYYKAALEKPISSFIRTRTGALIVDQSKPQMRAEPWMFRFFRLRRDIQTGAWHPEDKDIEMLKAEAVIFPWDLE